MAPDRSCRIVSRINVQAAISRLENRDLDIPQRFMNDP